MTDCVWNMSETSQAPQGNRLGTQQGEARARKRESWEMENPFMGGSLEEDKGTVPSPDSHKHRLLESRRRSPVGLRGRTERSSEENTGCSQSRTHKQQRRAWPSLGGMAVF